MPDGLQLCHVVDLLAECVIRGQPALIHRRGRKGGKSDDIADTEDVVDTGAELLVDLNATTVIRGDAGVVQVEFSRPVFQFFSRAWALYPGEQLICGTQVHVSIDDRDEAVAPGQRVTPYLPALLALSASSPFQADGTDTGYASSRTLLCQRWPTTGLPAPVNTAAEYDQLVNDLVATGVISDAGMVYFDVRPANSAPTLELRICDSYPSVDTIVLIAGLFSSIGPRESRTTRCRTRAHRPAPAGPRSSMAGGALRHGRRTGRPGWPDQPTRGNGDLMHRLQPQLEAAGDWHDIADLTRHALEAARAGAR